MDTNHDNQNPSIELNDSDVIVSDLPLEVQAAINRWTPQWPHLKYWEPVALLVRTVVTLAKPKDLKQAGTWMNEVAKLAAWQVADGYKPNAATLLNPNAVDAYLQKLKEGKVKRGSLYTYKWHFKTMQDRLAPPDVPEGTTRVRYTPSQRSVPPTPYSRVDLGTLRQRAKQPRDERVQAHLEALLVLTVDVGLSGGNECGWVTPDDIVEDGPTVRVDVWATHPDARGAHPERTVTITDPVIAKRVLAIPRTARVHGEQFVLGGRDSSKVRQNRSNVLAEKLSAADLKCEAKRLRETWLQRTTDPIAEELFAALEPLGITGHYAVANIVYWYGQRHEGDR